jgi:hypothetical protein
VNRDTIPLISPPRTNLDPNITFDLPGGRPERFGGHLHGSPRRLQRSQVERGLLGFNADAGNVDVDVAVDGPEAEAVGEVTLQSIYRS